MGINKFVQVVFGAMWLILGLFMLKLLWTDYIVALGNMVTDDFYSVLYWVGITLMILVINFIAPYSIIINAYKDEE